MEKPWLRHYEQRVPQSIEYPEVPMYDLFAEAARKRPQCTALIFFDKKITYGKLLGLVDRFAAGLHSLGIRKGDRVALVLPNLPQYPIAHLALMKLGAVIVPTNPLYVERELRHQLVDSEAKAAIVLDLLYPRLQAVWPKTKLQHVIVTKLSSYLPALLKLFYPLKQLKEGTKVSIEARGGVFFFDEMLKNEYPQPAEIKLTADDTALLIYTGGTTGIPKGAILTHRNIVANAFQTKNWMWDIQDGREVILSVLPFFHSYGMTTCLHLAIVSSAAMVLIPRFETERVLKAISKHRVTIFPGVPTMYVALTNHPQVKKYDLTSVRACISGAAALPVEVQRAFESITGGRLVEGYGLSEASPVTHANPIYGARKVGSIGLPFPGTEAKIVDLETQQTLPPGGIGELAIRGAQIMKGYWNKPEETAQVLRDDWLLTGDIAKMDEDGYFYIVDRKKDMIISAGCNIYPREVEEVLYEHPKILEAAVVGSPDAYKGEVVKAFVVLREGSEASAEEIINFCKGKLASFKIPKLVEFRKELPKSVIGKILRRVLAEEEKAKVSSCK